MFGYGEDKSAQIAETVDLRSVSPQAHESVLHNVLSRLPVFEISDGEGIQIIGVCVIYLGEGFVGAFPEVAGGLDGVESHELRS